MKPPCTARASSQAGARPRNGGRWIFESRGLFPSPVALRAEGSREAAAVFAPWLAGGGIAVLHPEGAIAVPGNRSGAPGGASVARAK